MNIALARFSKFKSHKQTNISRKQFRNIQVVVRVRPLNNTEKEKRHFQCVFQLDPKVYKQIHKHNYIKLF